MTVVAVALSGRPLAAAARRAGVRCDVIDLFGDSDTRALVRRWIAGAGTLESGFDRAPLIAALAALRPSGIVYGAGFESAPSLLAAMAEIAPLIGNPPEVVAAAKDPFGFAATLQRLRLPHPEIRRATPGGPDWLEKRVGGAGGTHIRSAGPTVGSDGYAQRRAGGRPVSALFVADGRRARPIGLSEQWTAPAPNMPYRYGGCAAPAIVSPQLAGTIGEACSALTQALCLRGLNSLDLLVDGDGFSVLEINPRPAATLDIFDGDSGASLWQMHCAGVRGTLPQVPPMPGAGRAALVVYAPHRLAVPPDIVWPDWVADRSMPGTRFAIEDPVCTVLARGPTAGAARAEAARRSDQVIAALSPAAAASSAVA